MAHRSDPASGFAAVTPNDTTPLATTSRALFIGTGGDLSVKGGSGTTVVFKNVASGTILPIQATYVLTASTAADIVALF